MLLHLLAVEVDCLDNGCGVGIGNEVERRNWASDIEVGYFAHGNATVVLAQAHGIGTIDGGGVERLGRLQAHLDAGKRNHKLHGARWG